MNNNNKKRIFIAILFLIILFFLLTFAGGRSEVALVEFIDGFDNSLIDSQEVEIGDDAIIPEDPKHKNYVFTTSINNVPFTINADGVIKKVRNFEKN